MHRQWTAKELTKYYDAVAVKVQTYLDRGTEPDKVAAWVWLHYGTPVEARGDTVTFLTYSITKSA